MVAAAPEQKKKICSTLTSVVKASPLNGSLDPKQFFMLVNANFQVIYREGVVDLNPLWQSLSGSYEPEDLFALFLKFGEETRRIGLGVALPKPVFELSEDSQASLLAAFPPLAKPSVAPPPVAAPAPQAPAPAIPAPQAAAPAPAVTDDLKQRVGWALAQALKATPAGPKINTGQVQFIVTSRFEEMCDGKRFDFNPLLQSLLQIPEVTETELFVGIVRFKSLLLNMGIEMPDPQLNIDERTKTALLAEARAHSDSQRFRAGGLTPAPVLEEVPYEPSGCTGANTAEEKTSRKLKQFGLTGSKAVSPGKAKALRAGLWAVLVAGALAFAFFAHPTKKLDVAEYRAIFPLTKAQITDGFFVGFLDETEWNTLSDERKRQSTKDLEALLRQKGLMDRVAVLDSVGKMAVFDLRGERLEISDRFIGPQKRK